MSRRLSYAEQLRELMVRSAQRQGVRHTVGAAVAHATQQQQQQMQQQRRTATPVGRVDAQSTTTQTQSATRPTQSIVVQPYFLHGPSNANDPGWYEWRVVQAISPEPPPPPGHFATYAIGDLHGNPFRLIIFLMRSNCITLSEQEFVQLRDLYLDLGRRQEQLIDQLLRDPHLLVDVATMTRVNRIREILERNLHVNQAILQYIRLVLIGDILFDRGRCDIMTLLLLNWMATKGIQFTITLSNHDFYFLQAYGLGFNIDLNQLTREFPYNSFDPASQLGRCYISTLSLLTATDDVKQQMSDIVRRVYLPRLRVADYDLITRRDNSVRLCLYSHAPFREQLFTAIYPGFSTTNLYRDGVHQFDLIIEQINYTNGQFYRRWSTNPNFFATQTKTSPLFLFVNSRDCLPTPLTSRANVVAVFGHVGPEIPLRSGNLINLDADSIGRPGVHAGSLIFFRTINDSREFILQHGQQQRDILGDALQRNRLLVERGAQDQFSDLCGQFQQELAELQAAEAQARVGIATYDFGQSVVIPGLELSSSLGAVPELDLLPITRSSSSFAAGSAIGMLRHGRRAGLCGERAGPCGERAGPWTCAACSTDNMGSGICNFCGNSRP